MFLRIQDIRTEKPPSYHYAIYLNPPADEKINEHTPGFVGNLSLFSMAPHRMPGGMAMPRQEMSVNYDVSRLTSELLREKRELSVVLVPRGYHPVGAAPGYRSYYLNVMAGPTRTWVFHNDPDHEWLMTPTP